MIDELLSRSRTKNANLKFRKNSRLAIQIQAPRVKKTQTMGLMASRLNRFKRDGPVCSPPLLGKACPDMVDRSLTEGVWEALP